MKNLILSFLLTINLLPVFGQEYRVINAVNLNLREFPEPNAQVYLVLHAPCKVELVEPEDYYKSNPTVLRQWANVKFDNGEESWTGWVARRYLVASVAKVSVALADTTNPTALYTEPDSRKGSAGFIQINDKKYYNNGTTSSSDRQKSRLPTSGHNFQRGPRGGCFYYNARGNKVYVDRSLCN